MLSEHPHRGFDIALKAARGVAECAIAQRWSVEKSGAQDGRNRDFAFLDDPLLARTAKIVA